MHFDGIEDNQFRFVIADAEIHRARLGLTAVGDRLTVNTTGLWETNTYLRAKAVVGGNIALRDSLEPIMVLNGSDLEVQSEESEQADVEEAAIAGEVQDQDEDQTEEGDEDEGEATPVEYSYNGALYTIYTGLEALAEAEAALGQVEDLETREALRLSMLQQTAKPNFDVNVTTD